MKSGRLLLVLLLGWLPLALAVEKVQVLALFPDKAMLSIDGRQQLLRAGQQSQEGVRLLSATAQQAVVEIDGRQETLRLGTTIGGGYQEPTEQQVRIVRDNQGAYRVHGTINGRAVTFLVDTGANVVAVSEKDARRLGIPYQLQGVATQIQTAAGATPGYSLSIDQVKAGDIELRNVDAVVVTGAFPHEPLLGMSFLSRLEIQNLGNLMVLRSKY